MFLANGRTQFRTCPRRSQETTKAIMILVFFIGFCIVHKDLKTQSIRILVPNQKISRDLENMIFADTTLDRNLVIKTFTKILNFFFFPLLYTRFVDGNAKHHVDQIYFNTRVFFFILSILRCANVWYGRYWYQVH